MASDKTFALDAMGGDSAPGVVVNGAGLAAVRFPDIKFVLVGRQSEVEPLVAKDKRLRGRVELVHAETVVAGDERPSVALRTGRKSSMRLAIDVAAEGRAGAVVSAGNTGALMAMSKIRFRTMPGIQRPAIARYVPTRRGETVMLDLGANVQCDARNLIDFAYMGSAMARAVLGTQEPRIALLNVGSEDVKGHEYIQEAHAQFREMDMPGEYLGFVEGNDITEGVADVIVTDGFTGNVALKTMEGTSRLYSAFLRQAFRSTLPAVLGYLLARSALNRLRARTDPRRYNGAVMLGLNGLAVKSHGGADSFAFANAIGTAVDMVKGGFMERVRAHTEATLSPGGAMAANGAEATSAKPPRAAVAAR